MTDPRLEVVHVLESRHPGRVAAALAAAVAGRTADPLAKRLRSTSGEHRKVAEDLAHSFFLKADAEYKSDLDVLAAELRWESELNARRVLNSHGVCVKTRVAEVVNALKLMRRELGLTTEQLVTMASDCCAARVETESFRSSLIALKTELGT